MSEKELIIEEIKKNKPTISESSLKTYISILKNLFKKYNKDEQFNIKWFTYENERIKDLEEVKPNIKKTLLSALIAITPDTHNKKYKKLMMEEALKVQHENLKQEKTETQINNWISQEDLLNKFNEMKKEIKTFWNKTPLTKSQYMKFQELILLMLTSGLLIAPRRSKDWTEFKLKNITAKDNFLKGNKLYFNTYKGSNEKGLQIIELPSAKKDLIMILKKFIKLNPYDYLFTDSNGNKMNSVKINQYLEKIFGKKISINIFRHSYLSEKYPITEMKELTKDAKDMGTSVNMALNTYIKA